MRIAVRTIYIELRSSAERLKADIASANTQFTNLGKAGRDSGRQISDGMQRAHESMALVVTHGAEAALAIEKLAQIASKYTTIVGASGTATENLVNAYRAIRLALSPTPFTVATIATGILAQETVKLVNARAKLIEQQSLIAALADLPITRVERLDAASNLSGANAGTVRSLFSTLASRNETNAPEVRTGLNTLGLSGVTGPFNADDLAKIASAFSSIEDPVKRARAAVLLFGSDAGAALDQLNASYAAGDGAVKKYGLVLDELSRKQIFQLRKEFVDLRRVLTDFSAEKGWWESFKQGTEIVVAAADDMSRRAYDSFGTLLKRVPALQALAGAMQDLQTLSPEELKAPNARKQIVDQGMTADDLFAQAQVARARHATETLDGLRQEHSKQQALADSIYQELEADSKKRQADPNSETLLTPAERFAKTQRQQSASQQAAILADRVATAETRQQVAAEDSLTAAIGRGYIARRAADVETKVANELAERGGNAAAIRQRFEAEYDATHRHEIATVIQSLREQIEVERTQAAFQELGAEAVRKATLEVKIAKDKLNGATAEQIRLERELDAASKANRDAAAIQALKDKTRATENLIDAIERGPGAVRNAELANKYAEMERTGHAAEIPATKANDEAGRRKSDAERLDELQQEIVQTNRLTVATKESEEAVARVTLENKLADIERGSRGDKGAVEEAVRQLDAAQKRKKAAEDTAAAEKAAAKATEETNRRLDQELVAAQRLAAAVGKGPEAVRRAELENKFAKEAESSEDTPIPGLTGVTKEDLKRRGIENILQSNRVTTTALAAGGAPQERLRELDEELNKLNQVKVTNQNILDIELSKREIRRQYLETLTREHLELGTLRDGWQAFFLDMQQQAEKPGKILYDSMHSALDKLSNELANLFTGAKTSFSQMFKDVGRQIVSSTIKIGLQTILADIAKRTATTPGTPANPAGQPRGGVVGALGKVAGILTGQSEGKKLDGQSQATALWVQIAGVGGSTASSGSGIPVTPAGPGGASIPRISIPGMNRDAGGFERGPNAPVGAWESNGRWPIWPGSSHGYGNVVNKGAETVQPSSGIESGTFDKFRLPGGLINRTGQTIDGIPSIPQPSQSAPQSKLSPLGDLQEWLQRIEGTDSQALSVVTQALSIQRTRATDPTGKNGDPVYVNVVNQQPGQQSSGLGGILGGLGGALGGLGGGGGAAGGAAAGGSTEIVTESITYGAEALASGGDLAAGALGLVGEEGPELIVPKSASSIIPNKKKGSWLSILLGSLLGGAGGGGGGQSPLTSILSLFGKGATAPMDEHKSQSPWLSLLSSSGLGGGGLLGGGGNTGGIVGLLGKLLNKGGGAGGGISGILSSFGGFFGEGGDVPVGRAIVVGDKGPELIVPKAHGTVIPHDKTRAILAHARKPMMIPFGGAREAGGPVSPSAAYLMGERGPELLMMTANRATSGSSSNRSHGGVGSNHYYDIDARGTDPVLVEQRVRTGIMAAHNSAIKNAVQVNAEQLKRMPRGNR